MTRRAFVTSEGAGAVAAGAGLAPRRSSAALPRTGDRVGSPLGPEEERILALAALAPSSHNTQPWTVVVRARDRFVVAADPARGLGVVDPAGRELALSLGTFLENLDQAARAAGREVGVTPVAGPPGAPATFDVTFAPRTPEPGSAVTRIEHRRTLRKGYLSEALAPQDREALLAAAGAATFHPAGSKEAAWLVDAAVDSFRKQTWRDDAQAELAQWIRFSAVEIDIHRDGLTAATMEIDGWKGFYARHFMDRGSVTTKRFRDAGVDATATQAREGAGFLVITSPAEDVASLVDAGRRFERMALLLEERRLAAHPMSSVLEEAPWRTRAAQEIGAGGVPQFILRIGRIAARPSPVSPRRRLSDYVRVEEA
jgi:nitroreductase